jgi:hypothetical protein
MTRSQCVSIHHGRSLASGGSASSSGDSRASRSNHEAGARPAFPPSVVVTVKALACEPPAAHARPLSRYSIPELRRAVLDRGVVASIGETTLWRWLANDAIRPWAHRSWIFPRDLDFAAKAGRILDLYEGVWNGQPLQEGDFILSADEKTSIQARQRCHPTEPPRPGRAARVEHEYERLGAWAYLAAWDVRRARVFGRCESATGIASFDRLVRQLMTRQPYCHARRVFWIVDNGSSHRGAACQERLRRRWPNLIVVHTPTHASWLNQVEIYFSVVQRKALTPNDFGSMEELQTRLLEFQKHYTAIAHPFRWKFTRHDLDDLLARFDRQAARRAA